MIFLFCQSVRIPELFVSWWHCRLMLWYFQALEEICSWSHISYIKWCMISKLDRFFSTVDFFYEGGCKLLIPCQRRVHFPWSEDIPVALPNPCQESLWCAPIGLYGSPHRPTRCSKTDYTLDCYYIEKVQTTVFSSLFRCCLCVSFPRLSYKVLFLELCHRRT